MLSLRPQSGLLRHCPLLYLYFKIYLNDNNIWTCIFSLLFSMDPYHALINKDIRHYKNDLYALTFSIVVWLLIYFWLFHLNST